MTRPIGYLARHFRDMATFRLRFGLTHAGITVAAAIPYVLGNWQAAAIVYFAATETAVAVYMWWPTPPAYRPAEPAQSQP